VRTSGARWHASSSRWKESNATTFMRKRAAGVPPTEIPDADAQTLVDLVWEAPEGELLTVGEPFEYHWSEPPEVVRFLTCGQCGETVAEPYIRSVEGRLVCIPCSGYGQQPT